MHALRSLRDTATDHNRSHDSICCSAGKRQVDLPSSAAIGADKGEDTQQDRGQMMTADSSDPHGSGKRTEGAPKGQVRHIIV